MSSEILLLRTLAPQAEFEKFYAECLLWFVTAARILAFRVGGAGTTYGRSGWQRVVPGFAIRRIPTTNKKRHVGGFPFFPGKFQCALYAHTEQAYLLEYKAAEYE
jgi:hypothetical protein